ncbi:MAG: UDP-N-acetylmuramoyl-L-alanyl-D-glutamate--2,6-diaminopimelate ligase [Candidatus Margulisiibacteriota bacterium]
MLLSQLLKGIKIIINPLPAKVDIANVTDDSRKVMPGALFVAIPGTKVDATQFIGKAIAKGTAAVICEKLPSSLATQPAGQLLRPAKIILVKNARRALAQIAANYYRHPSRKMKIIGVTGTNGKTTVTYLLEAILRQAGYKVGVIGTISSRVGKAVIAEGLTTPPPLELQRILRDMVKQKVQYVVLEASSHALSQYRLGGVDFDVAIFTNLTHEHLDYHHSMQNYLASKQQLFQQLGKSPKKTCAVVNADDQLAHRVTKGFTGKILTYSIDKASDFKAQNVKISAESISFKAREKASQGTVFHSNLSGKYNVYNLLAAAMTALALKIKIRNIQTALQKIKTIPGRMEEVRNRRGFRIFVDFAHTPDGLTQALGAARMKVKTGAKLILLFGCPGDRDRTKRPVMAMIAQRLADCVVITTDDPHSEDPAKIVDEIVAGWEKTGGRAGMSKVNRRQNDCCFKIIDRRTAIKKAIQLARRGDVVLLAGRGHEKYQDFNGKYILLDDRDVVKLILQK